MSQYDTRIGSGFPVITVDPDEVNADVWSSITADLDKIDSKRGIMLPKGSEFMYPESHGVDFPAHLNELLKLISVGSQFPIKFLNGESRGAVLASDEDSKLTRSRMVQIFGQFKGFIQKLIRIKWGIDTDVKANIILAEDEQEYQEENGDTNE
jgi:hypothetical protein